MKRDVDTLSASKTVSIYLANMVDKIYTLPALQGATPKGLPPRSKGSKYCKDITVLPRLHPEGMDALLGKLYLT